MKTKEARELLKYLKQVSRIMRQAYTSRGAFSSIEEFVLKNGRAFDILAPFPSGEKHGKSKECFQNAFHLHLRSRSRYIYVEGYAVPKNGILPVLHAWTINEQDRVIDPTWADGGAYYGVPFHSRYVMQIASQRKYFGVIDAPDLGFPLLSGEHTAEQFLSKEKAR